MSRIKLLDAILTDVYKYMESKRVPDKDIMHAMTHVSDLCMVATTVCGIEPQETPIKWDKQDIKYYDEMPTASYNIKVGSIKDIEVYSYSTKKGVNDIMTSAGKMESINIFESDEVDEVINNIAAMIDKFIKAYDSSAPVEEPAGSVIVPKS